MAVEARHLNLFPSQLLCNREMLNTSTENAMDMYSNPVGMVGGEVAPATESIVPFYNTQIGDAVLQRLAKTMNNHINNQPLKDDSGLTFNNNVVLPLPRKRPREEAVVTNNNATNSNNNSAFISAPNSIAGRLTGHCGTLAATTGSFSFLGEDLSSQIMQQQLEVDRLISLHMEKVRLETEERRRKQSRRIIGVIEEAIAKKLRDKEEQIEKIGKLNWELEERVKSLYVENQIWRDLAQTNEATANALRSNLEQVLAQVNNKKVEYIRPGDGGAGTVGAVTDDAESCCGSSGHGVEDDCEEVEGGQIFRWRKVGGEGERRKRMCRRCGGTESSVLVLPCRHLCLCAACGPAVDTCPICNSTKNATVHVNLS